MKNLLPILLCAVLAANAGAQNAAPRPRGVIVVSLKNGQEIVSDGVRRSGAGIAVGVRIPGGHTETKYPAAAVSRIEFPQSPVLESADRIASAKDAKAMLPALSAVVQQQAAFRDIPGNFWAKALTAKIKALVAAGDYAAAEKELAEAAKSVDPRELRRARLQIAAAWVAQGDVAKAQPVFDEAIAQNGDAEVVAEAWVSKGNAFLQAKDFDAALLSFLRVPIFYSEQKNVLPSALLGAGRAYLHVEETEKARALFQQIVSTYPNSPAAAAAKAELKELGGGAS